MLRCSALPAQADEGAAAHVWQLLMVGQVPIMAFFAIKWRPTQPRQALVILASKSEQRLPGCFQCGVLLMRELVHSQSYGRIVCYPSSGGPGECEQVSACWRPTAAPASSPTVAASTPERQDNDKDHCRAESYAWPTARADEHR
jgi:hypothetical protein